MKTYSIYRKSTGYFTGAQIGCRAGHLDANVPDGCSVVLGAYDHLSQRVDLDTGVVIDYQPPQPSPAHEWDKGKKRWVYVPTALEICRDQRRISYPTLNELADAIYWQKAGDDGPMQTYIKKCAEVKKKYPKPQ